MRTLLIDNYTPNSPQTAALYEVVSGVTVHTVEIKEASTIGSMDDFKYFDVVVLSGSQHKLSEPGVYDCYLQEVDLIRQTEKPLLGICFGYQLMAMAFGESVLAMDTMIEGYFPVHKREHDDIFEGLPDEFMVQESHLEYVEKVPYDFIPLADSPRCPVEIMKHKMLPKYGIQCHPERYTQEHRAGIILLENFFKIASWYIT